MYSPKDVKIITSKTYEWEFTWVEVFANNEVAVISLGYRYTLIQYGWYPYKKRNLNPETACTNPVT